MIVVTSHLSSYMIVRDAMLTLYHTRHINVRPDADMSESLWMRKLREHRIDEWCVSHLAHEIYLKRHTSLFDVMLRCDTHHSSITLNEEAARASHLNDVCHTSASHRRVMCVFWGRFHVRAFAVMLTHSFLIPRGVQGSKPCLREASGADPSRKEYSRSFLT